MSGSLGSGQNGEAGLARLACVDRRYSTCKADDNVMRYQRLERSSSMYRNMYNYCTL